MCGLFGMAGLGIQRADFGILDELMLVSSTRGTDGAGITAGKIHYHNGIKRTITHKLVADPFYWKWTLGKKEAPLYDVSNAWFIGHTRSRSVGEINEQSCQPFVFEKIVGTHNGTIQGVFQPFNTDSEKLLGRIALQGAEKIIPTLTERDAYALVWYDHKTTELHFLRNKRRELWFATNKKRSVLYWASEERFLDFALDGEEYKKYYFEENIHHTLKITDIRHTKITAFNQEPLAPKPPEPLLLPANDSDGLPPSNTTMGETENELDMIPWLHNRPNSPTKRSLH